MFVLSRGKVFKPNKTLFERTLQSIWLGGLGGSVAGVGLGYARYHGMDKHEMRRRRINLQFAVSSCGGRGVVVNRLKPFKQEKHIRRDGLATIGGGLTAVLVTALFWNQASKLNLFLGGGGIGTIAGVASAATMSYRESPGTTDSTDTVEKEAAIKRGLVRPDE